MHIQSFRKHILIASILGILCAGAFSHTARAQSDGSAPPSSADPALDAGGATPPDPSTPASTGSAGGSAPTPASSVPAAASAGQPAVLPQGAAPAPSGTAVPRSTTPLGSVLAPTSIKPQTPSSTLPVVTSDVSADTSVPTNVPLSSGSFFVLLAGVVLLGGYALYRWVLPKEIPEAKKSEDTKTEEPKRCFDIKQLLDKKLAELTDLKGKLEGKISSTIDEAARDIIRASPAGEAFIQVEKLEKEYNKLKKLFTECMAELPLHKRVFVVHGWDGNSEEGWFPWFKTELEKNNYNVTVLTMPDSPHPKIDAWVTHLAEAVGEVDENTLFVGHSIGCQTILRYLERLPEDKIIGGATFVAGWFTLSPLKTEEEKVIAQPWLETSIDFDKVRKHTENFTAIFSDDDEDVPLSNKELFETRLGAKTILEHAKGHFSGGDDITELPSARDALISL